MPPLERLFEIHRHHYAEGTLEAFRDWFDRSGYGSMLENTFLVAADGKRVTLEPDSLSFGQLSEVAFENHGAAPWLVSFSPVLDRGARSVESLFDNFVRCIGHTHPLADFRTHIPYFAKVLAGSRFLMFHGAGSCLLLGAMFKSLSSRQLGEEIDLHYSHSTGRKLTHVFGMWRQYVVDPDQKTWASIDQIDRVALRGYIFQQLGVAANLVYQGLDEAERAFLFARMTRGYFDFYAPSTEQYMYERNQDVGAVLAMFKEARTRYCSPLSLNASDFPWKDEYRYHAQQQRIERPYFLVRAGDPARINIPPGGTLRIGLDREALPDEAELFATIFLGRVPTTLTVPLPPDGKARVTVPEFPWLIAVDATIASARINGRQMPLRPSRCGRFRIIGMGALEDAFDLESGQDEYPIAIEAPGAAEVKIILPFNAFALAADLVRCDAPAAEGHVINGRRVR